MPKSVELAVDGGNLRLQERLHARELGLHDVQLAVDIAAEVNTHLGVFAEGLLQCRQTSLSRRRSTVARWIQSARRQHSLVGTGRRRRPFACRARSRDSKALGGNSAHLAASFEACWALENLLR